MSQGKYDYPKANEKRDITAIQQTRGYPTNKISEVNK